MTSPLGVRIDKFLENVNLTVKKMGGAFSRFVSRLFSLSKKEVRLMMVGLDNAGKSVLLHRLKLGEVVLTVPTIGFNVETIEYKNMSLTTFDIGGQQRLRNLWIHYHQGSNGVIFVVDSCDEKRLDGDEDSAKFELDRLFASDELRNAVFLIYANKQDCAGALKVSQIAERLGLNSVRGREWHIQGCCAITGDGLYDGLDYLVSKVK